MTSALQPPEEVAQPSPRERRTAEVDAWLAGLVGALPPGETLAAVGALGRRELAPGSDLDLVYLHEATATDAPRRAEALWYSIWDSPWSLDHSVRTPDEALRVAEGDLRAALGLLDLRLIAGDGGLVSDLLTRVRARWVAGARQRLPQVFAAATERGQRNGELAFLLEPDLKEARGGLRDALVPAAVAAAQLGDRPEPEVLAARGVLLDVREALHAGALAGGRRPTDRLLLQEQDAVAFALGLADADALMAEVAAAARTVAYALDRARRRVDAALAPPRRGLLRRGPARVPLAPGVVGQGGEVVLALEAAPETDAALALRAARAAAESGLPLAEHTLERLRAGAAPSDPWTDRERDAFVALIGTGRAAIPVIETLDREGLWERWMPAWPRVRSRPQRNAFHRFTVDRHLLEAAAEAAALTREVERPDLLLLGALLHDLGKGWPGEDHTEAGIREVPLLARRMGLPEPDVATLTALVRCHILLAELATTRDTDDPATVATLVDGVETRGALELLRWLTEADSLATGPAMWSAWKAGLLDRLVRRAAAVLAGGALAAPEPPPLGPRQLALLDAGGLAVDVGDGVVTVVAPDRPGLLATVVATLGLARLEIRSLEAGTHQAAALVVAVVEPRFGGEVAEPAYLRAELGRALSGEHDVATRLRERAAAYPVPARARLAPPQVRWDDSTTGEVTVVQVRAPDGPDLLARVTGALADSGLRLHSARCTTLGAEAVDAFYVTEADGGRVAEGQRREEISRGLLAVA